MCELKIVQKKMPHCKSRVWLMYEINLRRFKWKTYSACVFPKRHKNRGKHTCRNCRYKHRKGLF